MGLTFAKNRKYSKAITDNINKAQRASFCIMRRARQLRLSMSCIIHIINTVVKPILLYGCEIFCYENICDLEAFYVQLLKRILYVKKSTTSFMVYAETGCEPLWVDIYKRATCFWVKISQDNTNLLANKLRSILIRIHENTDYESPYITFMNKTFNDLGLTYMLFRESDINQRKRDMRLIKSRIQDQYQQQWQEKLFVSPKAIFYRMLKSEPGFEDYLDTLPFKKRIALTRFRLSSHRLPIETGRWYNIDRHLRLCNFCHDNSLGDEFHYLFECTTFRDDRDRYLPKKFTRYPNAFKAYNLFKTNNQKTLNNLSYFVQIILSNF